MKLETRIATTSFLSETLTFVMIQTTKVVEKRRFSQKDYSEENYRNLQRLYKTENVNVKYIE